MPVGTPVAVVVFTGAAAAEAFVNGVSLAGRKAVGLSRRSLRRPDIHREGFLLPQAERVPATAPRVARSRLGLPQASSRPRAPFLISSATSRAPERRAKRSYSPLNPSLMRLPLKQTSRLVSAPEPGRWCCSHA